MSLDLHWLTTCGACQRVHDRHIQGLALSTKSALLRLTQALQCVLAFSCSLTTDPNQVQCVNDSECTGRGSEFSNSVCVDSWCVPEPKWSCLDYAPAAAS